MMRFGTTLFTKGGPAKALGSMFIALGGLLHYLPFVFYIFLLYTIIFDNRFLSPPWVVAIWVFSLAGDTFGYLGRREAAASGGVLTPKLFCSSRGRHSCSYLGLWDGGAVVAMDSLRRQSLLANYLGCNNLRPRHQRNDPHTEPSQRRIISF